MKKGMGAAAAAAVMLVAGQGRAAVTVLGDTAAGDCSRAAHSGLYDARAYELCSNAIQVQMLSRRDLAGTYVNRATMLLRRHDWTGATQDLDAAAGVYNGLGEIHVNRGAAYLGLHRYSEAVAELDSGLALGTEQPEKAYFNRAMARELTDDIRGAYLDYKKAAELSPAWPEPRLALSRFTVRTRN